MCNEKKKKSLFRFNNMVMENIVDMRSSTFVAFKGTINELNICAFRCSYDCDPWRYNFPRKRVQRCQLFSLSEIFNWGLNQKILLICQSFRLFKRLYIKTYYFVMINLNVIYSLQCLTLLKFRTFWIFDILHYVDLIVVNLFTFNVTGHENVMCTFSLTLFWVHIVVF